MRELERVGFAATYLDPEANGLVDPAKFEAALRPDTILASVMLVNNEIGVIQPIARFGEICRARGVLFHVDAAQATGKVPVDLSALKVDLMSFSAHKTFVPWASARSTCAGSRACGGAADATAAATRRLPVRDPSTHQIVGMGEAFPHRPPVKWRW